MLLHRAPAEARIPTAEPERRCELFRRGEQPCLFAAAEAALRTPEPDSERAARTEGRSPSCEGHRTRHLGKLLAAARALVSLPLAPGSSDMLQELHDPIANRPQTPYTPLPTLSSAHPFLASLRTARRGSAAGPSGITDEHLRTLLNDEAVCTLLRHEPSGLRVLMCQYRSVAAIRAGRIVALRKPNGRVRALVVGDVLRAASRTIGRTLAQEYASELQAACTPCLYGISTRARAQKRWSASSALPLKSTLVQPRCRCDRRV